MHCLILGNGTQGLGILRSLWPHFINIHLISDRGVTAARFSRYLSRYHILQHGTLQAVYKPQNAERLLGLIRRLVPQGARWPVFCVNDDLVHFLHKNREKLRDRLGIPADPIENIIDKYRFSQEIQNLGLHAPRTYLLSHFDPASLESGVYLCKGRLGNRFRNLTRLKGMRIRDSHDLESLRRAIDGDLSADDVLVQEKLVRNQEVLSCCGFSVDGELIRHFQYVKLRQHPNEFGTGTFLKSIYNSRLLNICRRIIGHFGYTGIFEIEFIYDGKHYVIIEMNPRTWKSVHFATLCGQNVCAVSAAYIQTGIVPKPHLGFSVGKTWVHLSTDIPILIKNGLSLRPGYNRNTYFCVLNKKDPIPFIAEILLAPLIVTGL